MAPDGPDAHSVAPGLFGPWLGGPRFESEIINFWKSEQNGTAFEVRRFHRCLITAPYRQLPVTESSVMLPPNPRRSMSNRLPCSKCKAMTMLARITPGPPGFDIHTFECLACNRVYQRVVERVDPMKSRKTAGWLQGELRAPT